MCVYVAVCVCRTEVDVWCIPHAHSTLFFETGLFNETGAMLTGQRTLLIHLFVPTQCQDRRPVPERLSFMRDLNTCPHACETNTLVTEPSPHP